MYAGLWTKNGEQILPSFISIQANVVDLAAQIRFTKTYSGINKHFLDNQDDDGTFKAYLNTTLGVLCGFEINLDGKKITSQVISQQEAMRRFQQNQTGTDVVKEADFTNSNQDPYIEEDFFLCKLNNLSQYRELEIIITYATEMTMQGDYLLMEFPTSLSTIRSSQIHNTSNTADENTQQQHTTTNKLSSSTGVLSTEKQGLSIELNLEMPSDISEIISPSHAKNIEINYKESTGKVVYKDSRSIEVVNQSDLVVLVKLQNPHGSCGFIECNADGTKALMIAFHPQLSLEKTNQELELIFLVDCSESMEGYNIKHAKKGLQLFLHSLSKDTYFNIIAFGGSKFNKLFPQPVKYENARLQEATKFVESIKSMPGDINLLAPLNDIYSNATSRPRKILLLTDGRVSNFGPITDLVRQNAHNTSVFPIGMGEYVSRQLVYHIASAGCGVAELAIENDTIESKVMRQLKRAYQPAISNIRVDWGSLSSVNQAPRDLRTLFLGDRLTIYNILGKEEKIDGNVVKLLANGPTGPVSFPVTIKGDQAKQGNLIHNLAAYTLISDLQDQIFESSNPSVTEQLRQKVINLGVKYSLATNYTSFFSVEQQEPTPAVTASINKSTDKVPQRLHPAIQESAMISLRGSASGIPTNQLHTSTSGASLNHNHQPSTTTTTTPSTPAPSTIQPINKPLTPLSKSTLRVDSPEFIPKGFQSKTAATTTTTTPASTSIPFFIPNQSPVKPQTPPPAATTTTTPATTTTTPAVTPVTPTSTSPVLTPSTPVTPVPTTTAVETTPVKTTTPAVTPVTPTTPSTTTSSATTTPSTTPVSKPTAAATTPAATTPADAAQPAKPAHKTTAEAIAAALASANMSKRTLPFSDPAPKPTPAPSTPAPIQTTLQNFGFQLNNTATPSPAASTPAPSTSSPAEQNTSSSTTESATAAAVKPPSTPISNDKKPTVTNVIAAPKRVYSDEFLLSMRKFATTDHPEIFKSLSIFQSQQNIPTHKPFGKKKGGKGDRDYLFNHPQTTAVPVTKKIISKDIQGVHQEIFKKFNINLNRISMENYGTMVKAMEDIKVPDEECLNGFAKLLFEKAVVDPKFSAIYAILSKHLQDIYPAFGEKSEKSFKRALLNNCQKEFEVVPDRTGFENLSKDDLEEEEFKIKRRTLGNIKFIGELYKHQVLGKAPTKAIMNGLITKTQSTLTEESIEALAKLVTVAGKTMDDEEKPMMDDYFKKIIAISEHKDITSRGHYLLLNLIDLRANKWKVSVNQMTKASKEDAEKEERFIAKHASGSAPSAPSSKREDKRGDDKRGGTPNKKSGFGFGSGSGGKSKDGWETVKGPAKGRKTPTKPGRNDGPFGPSSNGGAKGSPMRGAPTRKEDVSSPQRANMFSALEDDDYISPSSSPKKESKAPSKQESKQPVVKKQPEIDLEKIEANIDITLDEYIESEDVDEAMECIKEELNYPPAIQSKIFGMLISKSFEKREKDKTKIAELFKAIVAAQLFTNDQIKDALKELLTNIEEIEVDLPFSSKFLAAVVGVCIEAEIMPLNYLEESYLHLVDTGKAEDMLKDTFDSIVTASDQERLAELYEKTENLDILKLFRIKNRNITYLQEEFYQKHFSYLSTEKVETTSETTPDIDLIEQVVMIQTADGYWELSKRLAGILNIPFTELTTSDDSIPTTHPEVWATCLAYSFIQLKSKEEKEREDLELVFQKSLSWLNSEFEKSSKPSTDLDQVLLKSKRLIKYPSSLHIPHQHQTFRIGIIGSGIGGSSCAYYINKILGPNHFAKITVFEKQSTVGGRAKCSTVDDGIVELGGSVIHPLNHNINNFVRELNLEKRYLMDNESFSIWNGKEMVFTQNYFSFVDKVKLMVNYYWDPIRFKNSRDDIVKKFLSSYSNPEPFHSVEEFFEKIGLTNTTKFTAKQYFFNEVGLHKEFVEDILSSAIRVNYNQNYDEISAFAAYIALVGTEDGLYSIKGGNHLLPDALIKNSTAEVIQADIKEVKKIIVDDGKKVEYQVSSSNGDKYTFDIVVIATPMELSNIKLVDIETEVPFRDFKDVNVYLIAADKLNSTFFGLPQGSIPPEHVLTSHNTSIPFYCVSKNPRGKINDGRTLYKIFAPTTLETALFDQVFSNHSTYIHHLWQAYPVLTPKPNEKFPPIQIDKKGLYYVNAFEHAVSTMETETIASKNIARLIAKYIKRPYLKL
eukprot:gene4874-6080_t